ncbi:unnamed protein product [Musa banksii]
MGGCGGGLMSRVSGMTNVSPLPYFSSMCETLSLSEISSPKSIDRLKIALLPPSSVRGFPQITDSHLDWGGATGFQDSTKVVERSPNEVDLRATFLGVVLVYSSIIPRSEKPEPQNPHFLFLHNNILPTFLQTNVVTTEAKEITRERV